MPPTARSQSLDGSEAAVKGGLVRNQLDPCIQGFHVRHSIPAPSLSHMAPSLVTTSLLSNSESESISNPFQIELSSSWFSNQTLSCTAMTRLLCFLSCLTLATALVSGAAAAGMCVGMNPEEEEDDSFQVSPLLMRLINYSQVFD